MLLNLYIENLILIDKVELNFSPKLNMLTGETGAGKSIIFDAIGFVLGDKVNKDIIRTGEEKALVKAMFSIENENIKEKLSEFGVYLDEDILMVEREISSNGRSVYRINGRPNILSVVKDIRRYIVDIFSQNEHQGLLNEEKHICFLDSFIGEPITEIKKVISAKYTELKNVEEEIHRIESDAKERERNIDLFQYQIQEIDEAKLTIGEEIELQNRKKFLSNAQKISEQLNFSHSKLNDSEYGQSIIDGLDEVVSSLKQISDIDNDLNEIEKMIEEAYYSLEEAKHSIKNYINNFEIDDEELSSVIERIDLINKLKRKYGEDIEEILKYNNEIKIKYQKLINFNEEVINLEKQKETLNSELIELCNRASNLREEYSIKLEKDIKIQLDELDMKNVQFKVSKTNTSIGNMGFDKIEFMISTNIGEPFRNLEKIVSGGELSRIMLAMKIVLSKSDNAETMLFDEIDTGISGKAAWSVAQKLAILSQYNQILCITHLPQIASMADNHIFVKKIVKSGSTFSSITNLKQQERYLEIVRLLDGSEFNETSIEHSKQILNNSEKFKNQLVIKLN